MQRRAPMESIGTQQVNEGRGTEEPEPRNESPARRSLLRPSGRVPRSTRDMARSERLLALFSPLALLVIWEIASRAGWLNAFFFPPPTAVLGALKRLTLSGDLPRDVLATARR